MKKTTPSSKVDLRQQAEAKLDSRKKAAQPESELDTRRLLHELEVHQIELEMQNEELVQSRAESEALIRQYAGLYDGAPVGYFTVGRDGTIRQVNLAGAKLLGLERSSLIDRRLGVFVSEGSRPAFNAFLEKAFTSRKIDTCEIAFQTEGPGPLWAHLEGHCQAGQECKLIVVDITTRMQTEQALLLANERLSLAQSASKAGTWDWDMPTGKLAWSPEMFRLFGLDPDSEAATFDAWRTVLHPDDRQMAEERINQAVRDHVQLNNEYRIVTPSGQLLWINALGDTHYAADGTPLRMSGLCIDITARKQAEVLLSESEERFRSLYENATIGMYRTSPDGHILMANPALLKMLGYENFEELSQRNLEKAGFEPEYPRREFQERIEREGGIRGLEAAWKRHDGTSIYVRESAYLVRGKDNQILYYEGTVEDITARKQAEEELEKNHALLSNLTRLVPGVVYQYRLYPDGRSAFPYASPGMNDIYEVTPEQVQEDASPVFTRLHPEDDERVANAISESAQTLNEFYCEYRVILPRQGLRWRFSQAHPERMPDGGTLWHGIISDVTERKQAEEALQLSEQISRQRSYQLQMVNQIALKITSGLDFDQLMQTLYEQCLQLVDANTFYVALYDPASGMINFPFSYSEGERNRYPSHDLRKHPGIASYVIEKNQAVYIPDISNLPAGITPTTSPAPSPNRSYLGIPLTIGGQVIGVLSMQSHALDPFSLEQIESLKLLALQAAIAIQNSQLYEQVRQLNTGLEQRVEERTRQLREAQDKMLRQEKLAILGQLAGGVGHELRNPLSVISASIYYLKLAQPQADPRVSEHHAMIEQEVRNADKIITDLLDFARGISSNPQPASVPELVLRTLKRFPAPATVKVNLKLPAGLPPVFADPRQVEQILGNLVQNACQAIGADGKLTISAKLQKEMLALAVADTGSGISPENMKKLFEPLFTTKTKGIGLGLAVSKKLAEANHGNIEVHSEIGKGSTFTLWLPVSKNDGSK